MKLAGPPVPLYETGPACAGCPYRSTSLGYAPHSGSLKSLFLFLLEALGANEAELGRNAVGPTGDIFNRLLRENTSIRRSEQLVANVVCCMPVKVGEDGNFETVTYNKKIKGRWVKYTTYVTEKPSPGQIRECAARYTDKLLKDFQGKYIVTLGKVPISYMLQGNISIKKKRGTIHISGSTKTCEECEGRGRRSKAPVKCKVCGGRGWLKCEECGRWKHLKSCSRRVPPSPNDPGWYSFIDKKECRICSGEGTVPRPAVQCKECEGSGRVAADPKNPFICERLKEGQILFPTFHPAMLMAHRNPEFWALVARDFSRLDSLEEEIGQSADIGDYTEEPDEWLKREVVYAN